MYLLVSCVGALACYDERVSRKCMDDATVDANDVVFSTASFS